MLNIIKKIFKCDKKDKVKTKSFFIKECWLSDQFISFEQYEKAIKVEKKEIIYNNIALKVLDENQQKLKSLLEDFSTTHFLAWWTAIALYLWHRKSIDFDFFSDKVSWSYSDFIKRITKYWLDVSEKDKKNYSWIEFENQDEIHVSINWVKISLINYFRTLYDNQKILISWDNYILWWLRIASLEELVAMKHFAMISRKKWKDAVDLYFLIKELNKNLEELLEISEKKYYINIFNREAILEQLISKDWDKTESVIYLLDEYPTDQEIENYLEKEAIKIIWKKI